jgi:anti-sigma regulatory factor (Ser/Thr protein kinase)
VAGGLRDAGIHEAMAERLVLVASELVTNAIVHARSYVEVRVMIDLEDVSLEVLDEEPRDPRRVPPCEAETSGRGLVLVDALADEWGVAHVEGNLGKMVWARVGRG